MPKKIKKILLPAVILLVLIGVFYFLYQTGVFKKFKTPEAEKVWREQQEQFAAQLIKAGDFDACSQINYKTEDGIDYKTVCRNNIAFQKAQDELDLNWCAKLDNRLFQLTDCQRSVIFVKMDKEKNLSVCDIAPSEELKKECQTGYWFMKAISDNNAAVCDNLGTENRSPCRDNLLLEKLRTDWQKASCADFSADYLKTDCENFKKIKAGEIEPAQMYATCQTLFDPRLRIECGGL